MSIFRSRIWSGGLLGLVLAACGGTSAPPIDRGTAAQDSGAFVSDGSSAAPTTCNATTQCSLLRCRTLTPQVASCRVATGCVTSQEPCPQAFFLEIDEGGKRRYAVNGTSGTEASARCVLTQLRDAAAGTKLKWSGSGGFGGVHSYSQVFEITEGRRVFGSSDESVDSPAEMTRYTARPLRPAAYFVDCLAANDVDRYGQCLADALLPCP